MHIYVGAKNRFESDTGTRSRRSVNTPESGNTRTSPRGRLPATPGTQLLEDLPIQRNTANSARDRPCTSNR